MGAAMAATNLSLLNFRIRVMQPHDTPCELRPTVVVLPLPILPQDTQAQLGHRVLKMISLHFLESLCSTLAGYIPWRAIPRIPRDFPANTLICALFLFRFVIQFLRAQDASLGQEKSMRRPAELRYTNIEKCARERKRNTNLLLNLWVVQGWDFLCFLSLYSFLWFLHVG